MVLALGFQPGEAVSITAGRSRIHMLCEWLSEMASRALDEKQHEQFDRIVWLLWKVKAYELGGKLFERS